MIQMALQAATVDLLVEKACFEPQVAMAVATAIDSEMNDSRFVTVPILDARLAEFRADVRTDLLRLDHKIDQVRVDLERKIDTVRTDLERKIDTVRTDLDLRIDTLGARLDNKIDVGFARLKEMIAACCTKAEMERTKAELMRWILLTMLGSAAIHAAVTAVVKALPP
jgi:hypothetical protein